MLAISGHNLGDTTSINCPILICKRSCLWFDRHTHRGISLDISLVRQRDNYYADVYMFTVIISTYSPCSARLSFSESAMRLTPHAHTLLLNFNAACICSGAVKNLWPKTVYSATPVHR